jgi:hypothetical protein
MMLRRVATERSDARRLPVIANVSEESIASITLMMKAIRSSEMSVSYKSHTE